MATALVSTGVQFPDSTIQTTAASAGAPPNLQSQLFTSSSSWTAPTGVTKVRLTVIGGGGGAGANGCGGGYGGGGGYGFGIYTVTPGTVYTVTVGGGGTGGNTVPSSGSAGGTSSFGALLSATGGAGGSPDPSGANGSASSGNLRNSSVTTMGFPAPWGGGAYYQSNASISPVTWSVSANNCPGAYGATWNSGQKGSGGVSGIVYVEWVG